MSLLELSLPLDPLLINSHWAWLIALCLATVATFSRLSPFSFFMGCPPISNLTSSRQVKLHVQLGTEETPEELNSSESDEAAVCEGHAEVEKEHPWSSLHITQCGPGEEDEKFDKEEGEEVHLSWVSSLLEAPRMQAVALRTNLVEASSPALEAHRACASCVQATRWSHGLHRQISARVGLPWQCIGTRVGISLDHQTSLSCVAENLCTQNVPRKMWSCQELQMLQLLQVPCMQPTISAVEVGNCDSVAHLGFCDGKIALWDVEKRVCSNCLCDREGTIAALFAAPSHPRLAIATGQSAHNPACSIVRVWDDRSASRCGSFVLLTPARGTRVFQCRAHELSIAGEGYVTRHDLRMLKGDPTVLHKAQSEGKLGGQGSKNRGPDYQEYQVKLVNDEDEEETDEYLVMDDMCSSFYYEGKHASKKRRCSLLRSCLPFMCCLVQNP